MENGFAKSECRAYKGILDGRRIRTRARKVGDIRAEGNKEMP